MASRDRPSLRLGAYKSVEIVLIREMPPREGDVYPSVRTEILALRAARKVTGCSYGSMFVRPTHRT